MMKRLSLLITLLLAAIMNGQAQQVLLRVDAQSPHQQISGFGGFVCSPQFTYGHMSDAEISKVWGTGSTVGCNIMRLYLPIGRSSWWQSLETARKAKQRGLIVFASPWGQPAEWKTNGTSNAKDADGTLGYLKRENWPDYAQYLNDYVEYLRENGVELDAISIQNEPDWPAQYAGCLWSADEIAEFVRLYGAQIGCPVIAPETLAVSDTYANALNKDDVLSGFDIYGGHQYGGIQTAYKKLADKGKQLWMTEYLINWNENSGGAPRSFDYKQDIFNFFRAINTCMLGDFNAWIHYSAKRFYGMIGDGEWGTTAGTVTKRGYVMAHFARFVTGMTRLEATFTDESQQPLEGSAYLSQSADTVVVVVANPAAQARQMIVDLPFYTTTGRMYYTSSTRSMVVRSASPAEETCRPVAEVPAMSIVTLLYTRSRDRQPSLMTAQTRRFDLIEDQQQTKTAFGTAYRLSGSTRTFDHSTPIISTQTTAANGYLQLQERYSQLVMQVRKVTSTMNLSSAKTTLYYVNGSGRVSAHNYGDIDLSRRENFNLVFDLSPATLTDGCRGVIALTNDNWTSRLTLTFGDVYLTSTGSYAATLGGEYVGDDSNVLTFSADPQCTSLDMTQVTAMPAVLPWLTGSNRVVYAAADSGVGEQSNIVVDGTCTSLVLNADGGNFRPAQPFSATEATMTCHVDGARMVVLPFACDVPDGVKVCTIAPDMTLTATNTITAHQPVLVEATDSVTFRGAGDVSFAYSPVAAMLHGTYGTVPLYAGDYVLGTQNGQWGLVRLAQDGQLHAFGVYASLSVADDFVPFTMAQQGISDVMTSGSGGDAPTYNIMGQRVPANRSGLVIRGGRKLFVKTR